MKCLFVCLYGRLHRGMNEFRFDFTFSPPVLALASHYLIQMSPLAFSLLLRNGGKTFMKPSWDMFVCFLDTSIEE